MASRNRNSCDAKDRGDEIVSLVREGDLKIVSGKENGFCHQAVLGSEREILEDPMGRGMEQKQTFLITIWKGGESTGDAWPVRLNIRSEKKKSFEDGEDTSPGQPKMRGLVHQEKIPLSVGVREIRRGSQTKARWGGVVEIR